MSASWIPLNEQNQMMVDKFTELAIISSKEVENAFRCVSRAAFVSKELLDEAFVDAPIKSSPHIHMSSPHLYATILENLELEPGMSFLNVGSGTGYFSSLAGYILKKHGINHGIELHEDLVDFSKQSITEFIKYGPGDAREICTPVIIPGNCFQLDQSQMKYDRVYCGGACSDTIIKFFLGFLKVGGFLIAPNSTKLIKLERVSRNEGVKSVIRSVWFAPLTRLDPADIVKLRLGLLPKLRFPVKSKKEKPKKTFITNTNFPMSNSPARKKISKMRALQDALDSLETDGSLPSAFCYVPQIEQVNAYRQYNKTIEKSFESSNSSSGEKKSTTTVVTRSPLESPPSTSFDDGFINSNMSHQLDEFFSSSHSTRSQLSTIGETSVEVEVQVEAEIEEEIRNLMHNTNTSGRSTGENSSSLATSGGVVFTNHLVLAGGDENNGSTHTIEAFRDNSQTDTELNTNSIDAAADGDVCKDIWQHLCSDRLWKIVLDNYYSVCATTKERKDKCFELKGKELVNPAANRLADMLLCRLQSKKTKSKITTDSATATSSTHSNVASQTAQSDVASQTSLVVPSTPFVAPREQREGCESDDIKNCLDDLVDQVCSTCSEESEERQYLEESSDSVLSFQSLSASFQSSTDDNNSLQSSFDKQHHTMKGKKGKKGTKTKRYVDIKTDGVTCENLRYVHHSNVVWTIDHDIELISYLVKQRKESTHFPISLINCKLFEKSKLIRHPLISSVQPSILCYRSVGLLRVVSVLDCVLDVLIGPSLPKNQFDSPLQQESYPLESFLDSSFLPSDSPLNVLEAQHLRKTSTKESIDETLYQKAKTAQDEALLEEVSSIISNETNNVKQQQSILIRKLELIDNINDQYKEQIKLLSQQIDLIEEQQQLLFEAHYEPSESTPLMTSPPTPQQKLVSDRKQLRLNLIGKRERINMEQRNQQAERKELLNMLEQLLSLETRLKQEMGSLERKGMGYLRGVGNDLSNFSQFVSKAEKILKRLRVASCRMSDIMQKKFLVDEKGGESSQIHDPNEKVSFRYQPHTILPRCRFLLPLSKKRYSFMREMLRTTERSPPKHVPIISVDRTTSLNERHKNGVLCTVFMQIFESLKNKDMHYRWGKKHEQWWEVRFSGEGIIDQGGGFRDSLIEMAEELCPPDSDVTSCLPLFIKTPNQKSGLGDHLECYTLHPSCKKFSLYRWLGKLMGACFRSDEFFPIPLPPYIWKLIVGEYVYWKKDFAHVDEAAVRNIDGLANLDEDAYTGLNIEQFYTTVLSDGTEIELIPRGANVVVEPHERCKYSMLARKARMMENCEQIIALREGLVSVIPNGVLSCLTWKNLEKGVCGSPTISVADLKSNCRYRDDLKATSQCVLHMWTALAGCTEDDRSRFIRFITGRKRLPSPFIVSRSSSEKDSLPSASTCGSNLFLPEYSSLRSATDKIKYAIYNCVAIDTDTSPW